MLIAGFAIAAVQPCPERAFRPAPCRIFYCRGLPKPFQEEISEQVQDRLQRLHEHFRAVYYYADLLEWLGMQDQGGIFTVDSGARRG